MHIQSSILLLAAISTGLAHDLAVRIPQPDLSLRSAVASGGWALATDGQTSSPATCPADSTACGATWCCPNSLTCVTTGSAADAEVCCDSHYATSPDQCIQDFGHLANTSCADSSWALWDATTAGYPINFFCCLPGTTGTQGGDCLSAAELETTGDTPAVRVSGTNLLSTTASGSPTGSTSTAASTATGTGPVGTGSGGSSTSPAGNSPSGTSTTSGSSSTPTKNHAADFKAYGAAVFAQVLAAGFAVALL